MTRFIPLSKYSTISCSHLYGALSLSFLLSFVPYSICFNLLLITLRYSIISSAHSIPILDGFCIRWCQVVQEWRRRGRCIGPRGKGILLMSINLSICVLSILVSNHFLLADGGNLLLRPLVPSVQSMFIYFRFIDFEIIYWLQNFTPLLKDFHAELVDADAEFEIVFVSFDR